MELSIKSLTLFGAVIFTGLSAGFFYSWSVSVIPGTQKVSHEVYLKAMQSINRAILNPRFFLIFFGGVVLPGIASIFQYNNSQITFWLLMTCSICYLVGTLGVTGLGNVPLNDQLEALNLAELNVEKLAEFRAYYESNWNRLHLIRTVCAMMSFALAVLAVFTQLEKF